MILIHMEKVSSKDLNLLVVFNTVWEERNLARVADRLCLSQPAISHSLRKLREQFNDQLFVRSAKGVTPTDFAINIAPKVSQLINSASELYSPQETFSPEKVKGDFVLSIGDYFSMTQFHRLTNEFNTAAPQARLIARAITDEFPSDSLEKGKVHLAITGFFAAQSSKRGYLRKKILEDSFSCLCRKGHSILNTKEQRAAYLEAEHLHISPLGDPKGLVDQKLERKREKRKIKSIMPGFVETGPVLQNTNLILTAPTELCRRLAEYYNLSHFKLPIQEIGKFQAYMHWHERTDGDPFSIWTRNLIEQLCKRN